MSVRDAAWSGHVENSFGALMHMWLINEQRDLGAFKAAFQRHFGRPCTYRITAYKFAEQVPGGTKNAFFSVGEVNFAPVLLIQCFFLCGITCLPFI